MITLYCVHPKGFNVGNDAIQFGLRELVHEAFGRVVNMISIPATSAYESHGMAGLTEKTIYEINRFGDGVIVGGGNLYENGELKVSLDALHALEPPMLLFSLSRGRVYNRNLELVERTDAMPRRIVQGLHEKASGSMARDQATLSYLHSIGCTKAILGACPTLFLNQGAVQLPPLPPGEEAGTLISIRNPALMNVPLHVRARVQDQIHQTIDMLRERDVGRIRLLCHDHRDVEFASIFQETRKVDFVYTSDVRWYLALIKAAKLIVSYRLHATVPALSYGTPVVSISYDERATSLLRDLGVSEWDIDIVETEDVCGAIRDRLDKLPELNALRERERANWDNVRTVQLNAMQQFAHDVRQYVHGAQARVPEHDGAPAVPVQDTRASAY